MALPAGVGSTTVAGTMARPSSGRAASSTSAAGAGAEAAAGAEIAAASATARAAELVAEGLRTKEVAKRLAAEFRIPRNDAYNLAMQAAR